MINLTEKPPDLVAMDIKMTIPQTEIFAFLQMKGYEIKAFTFNVPPSEEFLIIEPGFTVNTFTACKPGEEQGYNTLYLKVFEKEIKHFLNEI